MRMAMVRIRRSRRWRGRTETGEEGRERGASIPAARRIKRLLINDNEKLTEPVGPARLPSPPSERSGHWNSLNTPFRGPQVKMILSSLKEKSHLDQI